MSYFLIKKSIEHKINFISGLRWYSSCELLITADGNGPHFTAQCNTYWVYHSSRTLWLILTVPWQSIIFLVLRSDFG